MAKIKKFGTFSGVFTPSILTILGVIMYLRFPAIIGQAGLINTIGIIVIAHIISITTSLSVASLSTDKPVQNGGTYFMISRSLGLPIGGTLGLALFVGLSFSVSLYLIGFAESFLQYWDMDSSINSIRIAGTIVLVAVTTITFISTSLAIKSQYFIMVAIVLSLLSIFFGHHEFAPKEINLQPLADAAPFMLLFGIFFPAVTGFEAGVSMSGDLENPKKSLPIGAIAAVLVGLVVYIGLAFFYAFTVDANALVNDPQILFKISLVPALVIAGIWGATLSSALGSILGAPRILQAIAMDKIAPKFFAKGTGKTNEPRNALLLAFVIAEAGILIGELDVIARIVSMFFITTYAFLNLASAIESWSSSDFRPAFRIPKFVSVLGAGSAFIVMILLDFLALAGATVVLGLLYFFLQRKELNLESGDAWSSFWTNLAKRSLLKLSLQKDNKRNWRPNIVLFSGGEHVRPYLVEIGLALSGKLGALTDFELVIDSESNRKNAKILSAKSKNEVNHFTRKFSCSSLEKGIDAVTSIYGFSGFEPNTVLMGWSKNPENADNLLYLLKDFKAKNLNAIFLDYDKRVGFGKKQNIDIWWNGKGRHLSFSLNVLRFLLSDPSWRDAKVRILIINNDTALTERIHRNTAALLDEKRMKAEIKILSDNFGSRTRLSIVNSESEHADLILFGLSQKDHTYSQQYIESMSHISELPASLLILNSSDEFEDINVIDAPLKKKSLDEGEGQSIELPPLIVNDNKVVKGRVEKLDDDFLKISQAFNINTINLAIKHHQMMLQNIYDFVQQNHANYKKELVEYGKHETVKTTIRNHQQFLININTIISKQNASLIKETQEGISLGISGYLARIGNYLYELPDTIQIPYDLVNNEKGYNQKVPFQKAVSFLFYELIVPELQNQLLELEKLTVNSFSSIRKIVFGLNDFYEQKLLNTIDENLTISSANDEFDNMKIRLSDFSSKSLIDLTTKSRELSNSISEGISNPQSLKAFRKKIKVKQNKNKEYLEFYAESFGNGMVLINNTLQLDTLILFNQKVITNMVQKSNSKIQKVIASALIAPINILTKNIEEASNSHFENITEVAFENNFELKTIAQDLFTRVSGIIDELPEESTLPLAIFNEFEPFAFAQLETATANIYKIGSYYYDTLFYEPFYREIEQLERLVENALIESKEANSMLLFKVNNVLHDNEKYAVSADTDFYKKLNRELNAEKQKVEKAILKNETNSLIFLQNSFSKLFYHALLESETNISSQQREKKGRLFGSAISARYKHLKNRVNQLFINILNSSSSGIILSKKYLKQEGESQTQISQVLDVVEELMPGKKVYDSVPIFYRTLFSSRSKINDDFWVPRTNELNKIKSAVKRHSSGIGGALLIKGVHGSGKTALTRYAVQHLYKKHNIYWLEAPVNGSVKVDDLLFTLSQSVNNSGDFNAIFNTLPYESVIVINNLELWWERSSHGDAVLEKILELIHSYGKKVFFILNCNTHAYNIINKIVPINEYLQSIVECSNFNSKQLQQLIMSRHKSSGLLLMYKGKNEDSLSQLNLSLLFNSYFNISDGVPGVALNTWKANIVKANAEFISIAKPSRPKIEILNHLPADWWVTIALFLQHKNIDVAKLSRITGCEVEEAEKQLSSLYNSGIIVLKGSIAYTLGRNIEPYLVDLCMQKGII